VDTSKKEVTPYDGGKTTVLTGGVMLGGAAKPIIASAKCKKLAVTDAISNSNSRRSVRA
jgi:protein Tob/BTG